VFQEFFLLYSDDPQTRLDNAIVDLSLKTDRNFKTITEAIARNIFEVNEKLRSSKQRLEDCVVELSRKTETNFESNAEDSNDALDSVEARLTALLTSLSNQLSALELLSASRIESSRQSIVQHIKNANSMVVSNFRTVFERLNIVKNVQEAGVRVEANSGTQKELKDMVKLCEAMSKRVDRIESALYSVQKVFTVLNSFNLMIEFEELTFFTLKESLKNHEEILRHLNAAVTEKKKTPKKYSVNEVSAEGFSVDVAQRKLFSAVVSEPCEMRLVENRPVKKKVSEISVSSSAGQSKVKKEEEIPDISKKIQLFSSNDWSKINEIANKDKKKVKKEAVDVVMPQVYEKIEIFENWGEH